MPSFKICAVFGRPEVALDNFKMISRQEYCLSNDKCIHNRVLRNFTLNKSNSMKPSLIKNFLYIISHCDLVAWLLQTNLLHTFSKHKSVSEETFSLLNGNLGEMWKARAELHKGNYASECQGRL